MYQRIEGGMWRHVWVVSDIHGCYQRLMDELKRRHFNPYEDLLISVGDMIDRGPDSVKSLQLINEKWFRAVRGNHEQMALDSLDNNDFSLWTMNGGIWFRQLERDQLALSFARGLSRFTAYHRDNLCERSERDCPCGLSGSGIPLAKTGERPARFMGSRSVDGVYGG
jgi:predicted phosphodiesterase